MTVEGVEKNNVKTGIMIRKCISIGSVNSC